MDAKTRDLLERAVPFLRDAGGPYEDDGGNEPLELSRRIEDALEAEAALAAMGAAQQAEVAAGELTEQQKADRDAILYGNGFMLSGKHMPAQNVVIVQAPQQAEARAECTNRGRCDCIGECKHGRGGSGADGVPEGMALAYGYLWHADNPSEVRGDNLVLPPEIAAAKARLELRGLLTTDQRCRAIDKVRAMLAAAQSPEKE